MEILEVALPIRGFARRPWLRAPPSALVGLLTPVLWNYGVALGLGDGAGSGGAFVCGGGRWLGEPAGFAVNFALDWSIFVAKAEFCGSRRAAFCQ